MQHKIVFESSKHLLCYKCVELPLDVFFLKETDNRFTNYSFRRLKLCLAFLFNIGKAN